MTHKDHVFEEIKRSGNLPSLPEILLKLLDACENETPSLVEIAEVISKDPALSLKVLQRVNSSYYGLCRTFVSIEEAVIYLGANSIKSLAVSACIHKVFQDNRYSALTGFSLSTFWWNSLLCATLSRRLAKQICYNNADEAYLSGLLHDIGRLVLVSTFPVKHKSIVFETEDIQNEWWVEQQLLGVSHCEVGAWLVQNWKLSPLVADAIQYHHSPLQEVLEAFPLVKIVYLANVMREQGGDINQCLEAGRLLFDLENSALEAIKEGATEEVAQIAEDLDINAKPPSTEKLKGTGGQLGLEDASAPGHKRESGMKVMSEGSAYEDILTWRVKNIALASSLLEDLSQAQDTGAIIEVFERSIHNLFNIDKVIFFLSEKDDTILRGYASSTNRFELLSKDLILPVKLSKSSIVKTYASHEFHYLTSGNNGNLADNQITSLFDGADILLVPIIGRNKSFGVLALGLPEQIKVLPKNDFDLLMIVVKHIGLSLYIEKMQQEKAAEVENERRAAIAVTARKFAHEINNPLGIIMNYLTTLRLKVSQEGSILEELTVINEEINRISAMISQMDLFSNTMPLNFQLTDVNTLIGGIVRIFQEPLQTTSQTILSFRPDDGIPMVITSEFGLKQVIINLIKNASEAMKDGGSITISTGLANRHQMSGLHKIPSKMVEITVEDSGPGIPAEIVDNLYKPFMTTKGGGHSGLGLSIAHKTVSDMGGSLSCLSSPNNGTRFTIHLPLRN